MDKFYCNICEEEVVLENGKCPKCNTDWEKVVNEEVPINSIPVNVYEKRIINSENTQEKECETSKTITENSINNNIDFFLKWAKNVKILMIVAAILIAVIALMGAESTEGYSLLLLFGSAIVIFAGIILENNLKWKAYMLYTDMKKNK